VFTSVKVFCFFYDSKATKIFGKSEQVFHFAFHDVYTRRKRVFPQVRLYLDAPLLVSDEAQPFDLFAFTLQNYPKHMNEKPKRMLMKL